MLHKSFYHLDVTSTWPKMNYVFMFAAFVRVTQLRFLFGRFYAVVYVRLQD